MASYSFNIISTIDNAIIATETRDAQSEKAAIAALKKEIKAAGGNPKDFRFELIAEPAPETETAESSEEILITLDPANSPALPGEKRAYPPSIKHPELGTFWGCDQQKLLGTIRLNTHALDSFQIRKSGSRTTFIMGSTIIWQTSKPIASIAEKMALEEIERILKSA